MRIYTPRERTLIGMATVIPLLGAGLVMYERESYGPLVFALAMFVSVLATAICLKIVITGAWGDTPED